MSTASPHPPPQVTRLSSPITDNDAVPKRRSTTKSIVSTSSSNKSMAALPPKLVVKFVIHEEVSSTAKTGVENEGASDIYTEGNLSVRTRINDCILYIYIHILTQERSHSFKYCHPMHARMFPLRWFPIPCREVESSFFPMKTMCCEYHPRHPPSRPKTPPYTLCKSPRKKLEPFPWERTLCQRKYGICH